MVLISLLVFAAGILGTITWEPDSFSMWCAGWTTAMGVAMLTEDFIDRKSRHLHRKR